MKYFYFSFWISLSMFLINKKIVLVLINNICHSKKKKKKERQKCICSRIFRTSVNWKRRILQLSSNEYYIILLIIHWLLFLEYLHIVSYSSLYFYIMHWLLHHILIFKIHYSAGFSFFTNNLFSIKQLQNNRINDAVSFEKVFHQTKLLAFKSQKFISLKCSIKALKNSLIWI